MNLAKPSLPGRENTTNPTRLIPAPEPSLVWPRSTGVKLCKERADLGTRTSTEKRRFRARLWANSAISVEETSHETADATADRNRRRDLPRRLYHRLQRCVRRRQIRPQCRRSQLRLQRPAKCVSRRALRRDQAPMRRQVLRECVRGQAGVGGELSSGPSGIFSLRAK